MSRTLRRLRKGLRAIQKRDFLPPTERDDAAAAVNRLRGLILGKDTPT